MSGTAPAPAPSPDDDQNLISKPDEKPEVLAPERDEEEVIGSTAWDFLQTEGGSAIANKLLDMVQSLQKSTIDANAEQNKKQLENNAETQRQNVEFQHKTWRFWMYLQGLIFLTCIVATVILAWHDKLTGTASTVICTTLGFLFGRSSARNQ